jgi:hypothetical protein
MKGLPVFMALVRLFGAGQARPARSAGAPRFGLRLENLEGRAAPGALAFDHIGEEIPQTGSGGIDLCGSKQGVASGQGLMALGGDTGVQVDPTGGGVRGGDISFGVGIDPSSIKPGQGDFGVSIDPSASRPGMGGDFGVSIDPSSIRPGQGDFGVGIDPSAYKPSSGGNINV